MGGFTINQDCRRRLQAWQTTLKSRLSSDAADDKAKAVEIAKLVAYPMQGDIEIASDLRVETYFEALEGLPAWAVREARQRIVRGETEYGKPWGPGPTEFATLVRAVLSPMKGDLMEIETLLIAEPLSEGPKPGEKERIVEGFARLKAEMRPGKSAATIHDEAIAGLKKRAAENGIDFQTAFDAIPDSNQSGTFRKMERA